MNYDHFILSITGCIEEKLEGSATVELQEILKINGVVAKGISIRKQGEKIAPVIYLQDFYEKFLQGATLEQLTEEILRQNREVQFVPEWNYEEILDFEKVKTKIIYRLINTEQNEKLLRDVPNLPVYDLSIVFYLMISESDVGRCSVLIRNSHLDYWKLPISVLYQCARQNTPRLLPHVMMPMEAYAPKYAGGVVAPSPLIVLSNSRGMNGAGVILYDRMPEKIYRYVGGKYYLIPSSIHEFLIVPWEPFLSVESIKEMVREVNENHVAKDEVLSDHVYYFDGEQLTVL